MFENHRQLIVDNSNQKHQIDDKFVYSSIVILEFLDTLDRFGFFEVIFQARNELLIKTMPPFDPVVVREACKDLKTCVLNEYGRNNLVDNFLSDDERIRQKKMISLEENYEKIDNDDGLLISSLRPQTMNNRNHDEKLVEFSASLVFEHYELIQKFGEMFQCFGIETSNAHNDHGGDTLENTLTTLDDAYQRVLYNDLNELVALKETLIGTLNCDIKSIQDYVVELKCDNVDLKRQLKKERGAKQQPVLRPHETVEFQNAVNTAMEGYIDEGLRLNRELVRLTQANEILVTTNANLKKQNRLLVESANTFKLESECKNTVIQQYVFVNKALKKEVSNYTALIARNNAERKSMDDTLLTDIVPSIINSISNLFSKSLNAFQINLSLKVDKFKLKIDCLTDKLEMIGYKLDKVYQAVNASRNKKPIVPNSFYLPTHTDSTGNVQNSCKISCSSLTHSNLSYHYYPPYFYFYNDPLVKYFAKTLQYKYLKVRQGAAEACNVFNGITVKTSYTTDQLLYTKSDLILMICLLMYFGYQVQQTRKR